MYSFYTDKNAAICSNTAALRFYGLLACLLILAFALLISNTAAGLASGLARCLAFAAAAVLCAVAEITSFKCLDMLHNRLSSV